MLVLRLYGVHDKKDYRAWRHSEAALLIQLNPPVELFPT